MTDDWGAVGPFDEGKREEVRRNIDTFMCPVQGDVGEAIRDDDGYGDPRVALQKIKLFFFCRRISQTNSRG